MSKLTTKETTVNGLIETIEIEYDDLNIELTHNNTSDHQNKQIDLTFLEGSRTFSLVIDKKLWEELSHSINVMMEDE
jgi:hypothetical protein